MGIRIIRVLDRHVTGLILIASVFQLITPILIAIMETSPRFGRAIISNVPSRMGRKPACDVSFAYHMAIMGCIMIHSFQPTLSGLLTARTWTKYI